jgi:farnesyl diphosphate synthase
MGLRLADDVLTRGFERIQREMDAAFDALLPIPDDARARLVEAMRYAAIGGGKRVRPLLLVTTAQMYGVARDAAVRAGSAIEAIHVYSLIHDDLPCMDDDAMRHGKPTVHRAFDEATAVLAGDSLHALAFEILAMPETSADSFVRAELIQALAAASGASGMAGGQMMDIAAGKQQFDLHTVTRLQQMKTGALLGAAVEMGAILGRVPEDGRAHLRFYARDIGLAFQIADDLLDWEGDETKTGKALRKDEGQGKATFVSLMGADKARDQLATDMRVLVRLRLRQDLEGEGQQRVAGEDGGRLVEPLVGGGPAAAQVIVVHARQVVVDQRIGMDAFDRCGDAQGGAAINPESGGAGQRQERAQALAAAENGIAHRLQHAGFGPGRLRQQVIQGLFHLLRRPAQRRFEPVHSHISPNHLPAGCRSCRRRRRRCVRSAPGHCAAWPRNAP